MNAHCPICDCKLIIDAGFNKTYFCENKCYAVKYGGLYYSETIIIDDNLYIQLDSMYPFATGYKDEVLIYHFGSEISSKDEIKQAIKELKQYVKLLAFK